GLKLAPDVRTTPMRPRSARGFHRRRGAGSRRAWTHAEERSVAVREMARGVETAGDCDVDDRHRRLLQQAPGLGKAQCKVVARRRRVQIAAEQALELALGYMDHRRQLCG